MCVPIAVTVDTVVYHGTTQQDGFVLLHFCSRSMEKPCRSIHRLCIHTTAHHKEYDKHDNV